MSQFPNSDQRAERHSNPDEQKHKGRVREKATAIMMTLAKAADPALL
jgi:hypothetical protein